MKKFQLMFAMVLLMTTFSYSQNADESGIHKAINGFSTAADNSDADLLSNYLDDNYRIVMNQLFGSNSVVVMDRETYLNKIKSKEFGGDVRKINVEKIITNGSSATALVTQVGAKMTIVSLLSLVKNADGFWKIVSDIPTVKS